MTPEPLPTKTQSMRDAAKRLDQLRSDTRRWVDDLRWCRCGEQASPGTRYYGEQQCARCKKFWRAPPPQKPPPPKKQLKRTYYCYEYGGINNRGKKCWRPTQPDKRCYLHREPLGDKDE
jgi:hypothetical protein